SYAQVGLAALLVLINGLISAALRLGLGRRLLVASICVVVQLLLVGLVLQWVFRLHRWEVVVTIMAVMTVVAGVAAVRRTHMRFPGIWLASVASVWSSSWLIMAVALFALLRVEPWYSPQFAIPLLGMVLGNALTGISLALDRFGNDLNAQRAQIEAL